MNSRETAEGLRNMTIETPRGNVRFHPTLQHSLAPFYKAHLDPTAGNRCELVIDETLENTDADFETLIALPLENAVSGWYNSYTCI